MHSRKSAISLSWLVCAFQPGLAPNRQGQELSPTQPSLRSPTAIMITCSNSPPQGSGMPNHYSDDLLPTIAISGLSLTAVAGSQSARTTRIDCGRQSWPGCWPQCCSREGCARWRSVMSGPTCDRSSAGNTGAGYGNYTRPSFA